MFKIPTGKDIYIEVDGNRVAVVQSYSCKTKRENTPIKAFGYINNVACIPSGVTYKIELSKIIPIGINENQVIDFYDLSDFSLVIIKPDCQIIYSGCEWEDISEISDINSPCIEKITLIANKRLVVK